MKQSIRVLQGSTYASDFQASASICTACAAWEMLFLMCWMFCQLYLLLFLLSQPQHVPCSGRCRNMGSVARWAAPRSSPMSAFCQRFLLCPLTCCKATSSIEAQFSSLRPCTPFLLFSEQKKKRIDLEESFHLFNEEAEEKGYLELL